MKVTYWKSKYLNGHDRHSIRAKTRKEVVAQLQSYGSRADQYSEPFKVELEYKNVFQLVDLLRSGHDSIGVENKNIKTFIEVRGFTQAIPFLGKEK